MPFRGYRGEGHRPPYQDLGPKRRQIGLAEILKRHPTAELFDFLVATWFESGISGLQPKVLVPDADEWGMPADT